MKPRPRKTVSLSESVHQQLNTYALAASAAGVGILAVVQPAEAKVIYTPAHATIQLGVPYCLNFQIAKTVCDFVIYVSTHEADGIFVSGVAIAPYYLSNSVVATPKQGEFWEAVALRAGAGVGPHAHFRPARQAGLLAAYRLSSSGRKSWTGQWGNGGKGRRNHYLGLRFKFSDGFHFGWARVSVSFAAGSGYKAVLDGYAWQTLPNKGIVAGQTRGADEAGVEQLSPASHTAPSPAPAMLGLLALGAPGLSIWRREDSEPEGAFNESHAR